MLLWTAVMTGLLLLPNGESRDVSSLSKPRQFVQAERACQQLGEGWDLPNGIDIPKNLTDTMRDANWSVIWISVELRKLGQCQWSTGENNIIFKPNAEEACGAFSLHKMIHPVLCFDSPLGYICEAKECIDGKVCITAGNSHYSFHCKAGNWYKARQKCRQYNGRLAILTENSIINAISMELPTVLEKLQCTSFYVGLRCEDWFINQNGEHLPIWSEGWDAGQPSDNHVNCAKLVLKDDGSAKWQSENCFSNHHIICQKDNTSSGNSFLNSTDTYKNCAVSPVCSNDTNEATRQEINKDLCRERIALTVVVPLACLLAMIAATALLCRRYLKSRIKEQPSGNQTEEELTLVTTVENNPTGQTARANNEAEAPPQNS